MRHMDINIAQSKLQRMLCDHLIKLHLKYIQRNIVLYYSATLLYKQDDEYKRIILS